MGFEQEKWLEKEIKSSKAEYTIIGSGSIIIPEDRMVEESLLQRSRKIALATPNKNTSIL